MNDSVEIVVKQDNCCGCGSCAVICPNNSISIQYNCKKGQLYPKITNECFHCKKCLSVCTGIRADINTLYNNAFDMKEDNLHYNKYFGNYKSINAVSSLSSDIYNNATSGGAISAIVTYLFNNKIIDSAIVTVFNEAEPLLAQGILINDARDVLKSQGSKYCPVHLNTILKDILKEEKISRIGYVGLPCHISGLRFLQKQIPALNKKTFITVGLFCSRTSSLNATKYLLKKMKIKEEEIKSIRYRDGHYPSNFIINKKNGEIVQIPHLHWRYWGFVFMNFFFQKRCFLCYDKTAELADFSCGDNWYYSYNLKKGIYSRPRFDKKKGFKMAILAFSP